MFRPYDEHVPPVAFSDDLFLQVLGGFFSAQVGLERPAEPRLLFAEPFANQLQLRARGVDDLAASVDLLADLADLAAEGGGARRRLLDQRKHARDAPDGRARFLDRVEKR